MSRPDNIPDLIIPRNESADAQEQARCLESAADLVADFTQACGPYALEALFDAAADAPAPAVERARQIAESITTQSETLEDELAHFLALDTRG